MQIREPDFQIKKNPDDPCRFWQALLKVVLPTSKLKKCENRKDSVNYRTTNGNHCHSGVPHKGNSTDPFFIHNGD